MPDVEIGGGPSVDGGSRTAPERLGTAVTLGSTSHPVFGGELMRLAIVAALGRDFELQVGEETNIDELNWSDSAVADSTNRGAVCSRGAEGATGRKIHGPTESC